MSPLDISSAVDLRPVDQVLDEVLARAAGRAAGFGRPYALLWEQVAASVRGGKRFRSAIVLGTHRALGDPRPQAAVAVAAAFELLHTAFLIHDDLIDGDTMRRGRPNLAETMRRDATAAGHDPVRAERWAAAAAVLAGDLALGQCHRLVASVDAPADVRAGLVDLLDETLVISAGGELDDTAFGLGLALPTLDQSLQVAESKTAMYSFRAPLRAGAVLAGADLAVQAELDHHGRLLGRAFQLVDDLLGVFAPESATGKSNVSDLREGKRTPLMLHASGQPVWSELAEHLGRPDLDELTAARMRKALARSVAPARVVAAVQADLAEVLERAGGGALPAGLAPVVRAVAAQITGALADVDRYLEEARCQAV